MSVFTIRLRGTTYFGKPAGTRSTTYECSDEQTGDYSEAILYYDMVEETGGLFSWLFGARTTRVIKTGYVTPASERSIDESFMGAPLYDPIRHRQAMQRSPLPAGTYAFYRAR